MNGSGIDEPYQGAFVGSEHRFAIRVYFEDTDAAGIVYHANYLKFMERARSDMLRAIGIDQKAAIDAGEGVYAVAEARIKYRRPARLDDALTIVSTLAGLGGATATIHQRVMRGEELVADATIVAAFLSPEGRAKRQPNAWIDRFRPLLKEGIE